MHATPMVSVVIPTRFRPGLVTRAVRGALAQTLSDIEVVVVVDGPDDATAAALAAVDDPRLRVITLERNGGAPHARNAGVDAARAPWTALLDDDDEWLPEKLATQFAAAQRVRARLPIVSCRMYNRTPRAEYVIPRRLPAAGEPVSEYLTVRRGLFHGDGFVQTSTLLAPTELFRRVPFTVGLRRQQELDWTLRAAALPGAEFVVADAPLVIWNQDEDRPRISLTEPWQAQFAWVRTIRHLFTPRAYAAFLMSVVTSMAAPTRSPHVLAALWREAHRHGRPGMIDYLTFLQLWVVPPTLRHRLRDAVLRRRGAAGRAAEPVDGAHGSRTARGDLAQPLVAGFRDVRP
ncbi:glycosyl transferase [Pilimelia terevasa]|uniref:Glycosyl transferase n=1 Tax=Pilimelia terevasa TaxID=53372 RepID=A0A8J3BR62_9ACTN|nr:glycosyltransferase family 2 protein [Pilimelia terevasa]GGK29151.1 glycosyl transferase [Pilimelia terevasa]